MQKMIVAVSIAISAAMLAGCGAGTLPASSGLAGMSRFHQSDSVGGGLPRPSKMRHWDSVGGGLPKPPSSRR